MQIKTMIQKGIGYTLLADGGIAVAYRLSKAIADTDFDDDLQSLPMKMTEGFTGPSGKKELAKMGVGGALLNIDFIAPIKAGIDSLAPKKRKQSKN